MSGKRKAAEVERLDGKRPHPPLHRHNRVDEDDEDKQQPQHLKKHVQHSPLALQHSSSNSPLESAQHCNGDVSASFPSSPHTAPLPAELHTPPAIDDGLLASLTLSPLSSSATRRINPSATSLPSSPSSARAVSTSDAAATGSAKRSRTRPVLPPVPSLQAQPAAGNGDHAASSGSESSGSLTPSPAAATHSTTSSAADPLPVLTSETSVVGAPLPVSSSNSDSLSSQAVSVDSAIRGMQTISLSSLSFGTSSSAATPSAVPASVAPIPTSMFASSSSAASSLSPTPIPAPVSLPLIRLTLNPSRVRRTSSNEAAQGNLKKHKRSLFSPTPNHNQNQIAAVQPRTSDSSTDSQDKEKDREDGRQRKEAQLAASTITEELEVPVIARICSPATDGGSERDEEASVASLETAVSTTSYTVRSPLSFTSSSPSPSPSPSSAAFPSSTPIRCEVCNKDLSSAAQLEDHRQGRRHQHMLLMRQSGGGFACELCGKVFTCAADQEKHQLTERHKEMVEAVGRETAEGKAGVFALACELCGVTFTGFTQQRQHLEGKKHIAMARQHEREQKAETADNVVESKERDRQRDDSKGRQLIERDGDGTLSKKRKYGRASPAVTSQSHPQQQQPSPTPRHILPSSNHTPSTSASPLSSSSSSSSVSSPGGSVKRAQQQTIRYITPPPSQPHVLPPFRISLPSSRSVGTAGSVGSAGESSESDGPDRPASASRIDKRSHSTHSQRYQQQMHHQLQQQQQQQEQQTWEGTAEVDDDTSSSSSYSIGSSHDVARSPPHGYASDASYPHTSFSASPPFPTQSYPPHSMYAPPLPPSAAYGPPVVMPPAAYPSMLPPMYGFLSPSAAASLSGPVLPSHTPVTIMYPTELLLAQQYAHSHPYAAFPPLYLLPTLPPPMMMTMHTGEHSEQPLTMLQADGGQMNEQHIQMQPPAHPQQQVLEKVTTTEEQRDEQAAVLDPVSHTVTETIEP